MPCSAQSSPRGGSVTDQQTELSAKRPFVESDREVLQRRADSLALETQGEEDTQRLALLLFRIGEEWYAVGVEDVREIFQEYEVTPLPGVPEHILGVVNVRGEILSVTDPARLMRLGTVEAEGLVQPPAIVVQDEDVVTAMVVDEIGDIAEVSNDAVEPPISIIDRAQAEYIAGSIHVGQMMVGLINIERTLQPVVTGGRH